MVALVERAQVRVMDDRQFSDPQFVVGGPRIPSEVIRALEEERLIFFCGAGISIRTGLPNFRDLTLEAIKRIDGAPAGVPMHPAVGDALRLELYDKALDILEDIEGHRGDLRQFIATRLTRRLRNAQEQLRLHRALLDLARLPPSDQDERGYRLVTTNYDNRFEKAGLPRRWIEAAPLLGRPQATRTGCATFLHGRIETERNKRDPRRASLVLTSADFGDAYLRDGYAARFVLELFREFTVLFVGYSINDPVMRYLMDIFATENDERQKGQFRHAFSFVPHGDNDADRQYQLWKVKHVTPILYHRADHHEILIKTLEGWARTHRAGSDGRFQILMDVVTKPYQGDLDSGNLANAAWALSDNGHMIARRLGSLNPEESGPDADISWLEPLLHAETHDPRDGRKPLARCRLSDIKEIAAELCGWAMRHLEDEALVQFAVANERLLLSNLRTPFFDRLVAVLHQRKKNKPVRQPFDLFWQLLIDVVGSYNEVRAWDNVWRLEPVGATPQNELRAAIHKLQPRLRWPEKSYGRLIDHGGPPEMLRDLARYRISDSLDHHNHHRFRDIFTHQTSDGFKMRADLAACTDDLTNLLVGACRLGVQIDILSAPNSSRWIRESIASDDRNQLELDRWEWLIEAVVQSFEAACVEQRDLAVCVAQRWRMLWQMEDQALFGRLYLHAATRLPELPADDSINICGSWPNALWSYEYEPELLALLRIRGSEISPHCLGALIEQLLAGPPREEDRSPDVDFRRGKRLAKLQQAGVNLETGAAQIAREYLAQHPPTEDPRDDEVQYRVVEARWVGPPSAEELTGKLIDEIITLVDLGRDEYGFPHTEWSKAKQVADWLRQETGRIAEALEVLAGRVGTPASFVDGLFWALRDVTTQPELLAQIDRISAVLTVCPSIVDASFNACTAWIKALAASELSDDAFWPIWEMVRARAPAENATLDADISLTAAINSAGGHLAEAILDRFWRTEPKAAQGLPADVRERLTQLVSGTSLLAMHARLVCMPPLHALDAVDPEWTRQILLPHLSWANRESDPEVSALWSTHLQYGRWSLDLMAAFKADFLTTLDKRDSLDEEAFRSACWRFAALGIDRTGLLSEAETRDGLQKIKAKGARFVLDLLETRLRQSEQPGNQWREMLAPWLAAHWPRQEAFRNTEIFSGAADMLLETEDAFVEALQVLQDLHLVDVVGGDRSVLFRLASAENVIDGRRNEERFPYASSFPREVCRWLDRILTPDLPGHERPYLRMIIGVIEGNLAGGPDPISLAHLRDRAQ
jgi:SIR2-like domain